MAGMRLPFLRSRFTAALIAVPVALLLATACGAEDSEPVASGDTAAASCEVDQLELVKDGTLTVATDTPAYDPWFADNDPSNGKGFESAVAYAVAEEMGFAADQVSWVTVPFNNSYAPGPKNFDFDINQISITPERAEAVDFSDGYYSAAQAVIVLDEAGVTGTSLTDLKSLKLGAQTGTTSLTVIRDEIQPAAKPAVFRDTNAAKQALLNGQVDAIVADLPTAFYISAVEIEGSSILGQFQPQGDDVEEFGLLFEKGNPLVTCVNEALDRLKEDGTLAAIEKEWLSDTVDVPVLR